MRYPDGGRSPRHSLGRAVLRGIAVVAGLGVGLYGAMLYALRCFSTCPSDLAEDAIIRSLTLSLVAFALGVISVAVSVGTRFVIPGSWISTVAGALMIVGGAVTMAAIPALRFDGEHSILVVLATIDVAVGAGLVFFAGRARKKAREHPARKSSVVQRIRAKNNADEEEALGLASEAVHKVRRETSS